MCDRSNSPAADRTARCSSMIPLYCTGISQPPNSMIRAPRAVWRSLSGVTWTLASAVSVTSGALAGGGGSAGRIGAIRKVPGSLRPGRIQRPRGASDERPLGLERQRVPGVVEADPANRLELVVVAGEVAADRFHQEVMHGLVDPDAALHER